MFFSESETSTDINSEASDSSSNSKDNSVKPLLKQTEDSDDSEDSFLQINADEDNFSSEDEEEILKKFEAPTRAQLISKNSNEIDQDDFSPGTPKFASTPARIRSPRLRYKVRDNFNGLNLSITSIGIPFENASNSPGPEKSFKKRYSTPPRPAWCYSEKSLNEIIKKLYQYFGQKPPSPKDYDPTATPKIPKTPNFEILGNESYMPWNRSNLLNETKFSEANTTFGNSSFYASDNDNNFTDSDDETGDFGFENLGIEPLNTEDEEVSTPNPILADKLINDEIFNAKMEEPMDWAYIDPKIDLELKENRNKLNRIPQELHVWDGVTLGKIKL